VTDQQAKQLEAKMLEFAEKLGEYQQAAVSAGIHGGRLELAQGRREADRLNAIQEELILWVGKAIVGGLA
jgi:hypothetical protein